jgi:hypothetical protein
MSKHTPGPWACTPTSNHAHYRLTRPNGSPLPYQAEANDHSEQRANACLIAAAPDLLAALRRLEAAAFQRENTMGDVSRLLDVKAELAAAAKQAGAAIAKAEGRS